MREDLLAILERLINVRETLGEAAFEAACHRTRHAIACVVLMEAERRAKGNSRPMNRGQD